MSRAPSLNDRILRFLAAVPSKYVNGGEIERRALIAGYKASNASRRLRELYVESKIDRREDEKGTVEYKFITY